MGQARNELSEHQIVDTLQAAGNFNTLLIALDKTGLTDTLKGAGPFTIFAPNDEAFAKLPSGVLDALMKDPAKLKGLLLYHITAGKLSIKDLQSRRDKSITMMDNTKATIGLYFFSPPNSESKAKMSGNDPGAASLPVNSPSKATIVGNDLNQSTARTNDVKSPMNSESKASLVGSSDSPIVLNKSARVVGADVNASNGMIHVIDTVLAPGTHWLGW